MKKVLRNSTFFFLILILFCISACNKTEPHQDKPVYYFIDGYFVGSFEDESFYSNGESFISYFFCEDALTIKDYPVSQILSAENYYLYRQDGFQPKGEHWALSNQLLWDLSQGLSGFEDYDHSESLGKYAEVYHTEGDSMPYYRFTLPVELSEEDACLMPKYNFATAFFVKDAPFYYAPLATNADFSCLPKEIYYDKGDDFAKRAMMNLIGERGLHGTPYNFTQFISADFDNDGELEYLTIDNTPTYDDGWPVADEWTNGSHSAVLYNDGTGKIDVLFAYLLPYDEIALPAGFAHPIVGIDHCHSVEVSGIYDLNNDGYLEICLRVNMWESGYITVLSYCAETETFQLVMQANYGN